MLVRQARGGSLATPRPSQGPADTITPGEGKEKMEVPTGPAYHYLIPAHDAERRWKLSFSLDLTESLMLEELGH